jgi:hypothetical protein
MDEGQAVKGRKSKGAHFAESARKTDMAKPNSDTISCEYYGSSGIKTVFVCSKSVLCMLEVYAGKGQHQRAAMFAD